MSLGQLTMKVCPDCGQEKPLDDFGYRQIKGRSYPMSYCRLCRNARCRVYHQKHNWRLNLSKYGITPEQWEALYDRQDGKCAICGTDKARGKGRLHVDHDHVTGKVRGLLCHHCNVGLGYFMDDVARLKAAMAYLAR